MAVSENAREKYWRTAIVISALINILLITGFGILLDMSNEATSQEEYIEMNLSAEETITSNLLSSGNDSSPNNTTEKRQGTILPLATVSAVYSDDGGIPVTSIAKEEVAFNGTGAKGTVGENLVESGIDAKENSKRKPNYRRPQLRYKVEPVYSEEARKQGWEGTVSVEVQVLASGGIGNVAILHSSGYSVLDEAAVEAVRQWRFDPAQEIANGQAVSCTIKIPIGFSLKR